jgi:D-alanyl-D-alanine-carboxypeptidase/D-alanyl-D-alanine-endopeptidase
MLACMTPRFGLHKYLFILCAFAGVAAADPLDTAAYRQSLQEGVDSGVYDQLAIGWIEGESRSTWFLGATAKPEINTRFEIGALTEVFTGLLLAQAEYAGKLRATTTLGDVFGAAAFIDARLRNTTLTTLATHRVALPLIPPNLFPAFADDPYAGYTTVDLATWMANAHVADASAANYSPLDAGILGVALSRTFGTELPSLFFEKIFTPLSMMRSGFDDANLIDGHDRGQVTAHWHFGVLEAAAGLRASVGDLLDFLKVNLKPQDSPLRAAILLSRQPQEGATPRVGLGWNIVDASADGQSWPMLWRASTTGGFSAFIGFRTDRQQALVILGNTDADLSRIGLAWLQGSDAPPPANAMRAVTTDIDPADYTGLYRIDASGTELIVRADGQKLTAQLHGNPLLALRQISEDVFIARNEGMLLSFQREPTKVTNVLVSSNGFNLLARRLTAQAPYLNRKVLSVSAAKLAQLAGDYRLDAATFARVTVDGGGLNLHLTGGTPIALAAFSDDHFTDVDNSCEVTFKRDSSHAVQSVVVDFAGLPREGKRETWRNVDTKSVGTGS